MFFIVAVNAAALIFAFVFCILLCYDHRIMCVCVCQNNVKLYIRNDNMAIITTTIVQPANWTAPPSPSPGLVVGVSEGVALVVGEEQTSGATYGILIGGGLSLI